jgi:hypothetical protein
MRDPKVTMQVTMTGGFAYIGPPAPTDNQLSVAYLNSWHLEEGDQDGDGKLDVVCDVKQLGTELVLKKGVVVDWEPKSLPKPGIEFDLKTATVRFPVLDLANQPLAIGRDTWTGPPTEPADPDKPSDWKNLKWVPSLKEFHGGAIDPNWPNIVNGYIALRGGELIASTPSEQKFKKAKFDFKQANTSKHKVSLTDTTIYSIDIAKSLMTGGNLEVLISYKETRPNGYTKLVIQPQGNKVEFTLTGEHAMGPDLGDGEPLKDFCAFYQLLQPRPAATDFLVPYYIKAPSTMPPPSAQVIAGSGSPGFFCIGDWF